MPRAHTITQSARAPCCPAPTAAPNQACSTARVPPTRADGCARRQGLTLLGAITYGVVSIRKWQKIPSMPMHGRMDIKDVQASARQAGPEREAVQMSHAWDNL